jgi:hypothetical protein
VRVKQREIGLQPAGASHEDGPVQIVLAEPADLLPREAVREAKLLDVYLDLQPLPSQSLS